MGQNMGQKCGLATGQPNRQLSPPNLDLRHIQDHFGFTFLRVALTRFSEVFSLPVFVPSAGTGRFSSSAGNLLPRFQHGSKTWVRRFSLTPEQKTCPTPRCRDCTIAFRNCKSFLCKKNCRQTASTDTTQRQLTIRSNQTKGLIICQIIFTSPSSDTMQIMEHGLAFLYRIAELYLAPREISSGSCLYPSPSPVFLSGAPTAIPSRMTPMA